MREYETVFITQPNLPDSEHKQLVDRLSAFVQKHEGQVFFARNMGNKTLAYPIAKQTKGIYTCLDYAAGGAAVAEIERSMRLDENVIRFLTIVKTEDVNVEARAAEIIAKAEDKGLPAVEEVANALREKEDASFDTSEGEEE